MATRPMTACPRCLREFEVGRGKGPDELYCTWSCARAEQQRLNAATARRCGHCGGPVAAWKDERAIYCTPRCQGLASKARLAVPRPALEPRACELCGALFTPDRQPEARFCSRDHAIRAANARRRDTAALAARPRTHAERLADLEGRGTMAVSLRLLRPRAPALPGAFCASGVLPPDWWTSSRADETEAACHACRTRCPVIIQCRDYSLGLAVSAYPGVLGGLSGNARQRALGRRSPAGTSQRQSGKVA
jgi:hypothetical protein